MRTRIEKAIALIRQGHAAQAIEILENICGGLPYEKETTEEQTETLELVEVKTVIPFFKVHISGDELPEIQIDEEGWDFNPSWMDYFISRLRDEYIAEAGAGGSQAVAITAQYMLENAVRSGKVWRR